MESGLQQASAKASNDGLACPDCHGACRPFVTSRDYNRHTTGQLFSYVQCTVCGLVFMKHIPEDLRPFYAGGYAAIPQTLAALRTIAAEERYRLEPILRHKSQGKLLEIGPWRGVFSVNAKDAGFDVTAIEMDQTCVDFLTGTVGVNAIQSIDPAATMDAMTERFDVIAFWHSLEHLREPWKVIESAAARLAPGGILLIAVPNIGSYEFSLLKGRWRHLDAPRHLTFYDVPALVALCARFGLRTTEVTTHDELSRQLAMDTWTNLITPRVGYHFYTRHLIDWAYQWSRRQESKREHAGSGITLVCQAP